MNSFYLFSLTVVDGISLLVDVVVHVGDAEVVEDAEGDTEEELRDEEKNEGTHVRLPAVLSFLTHVLRLEVTHLLLFCGTEDKQEEKMECGKDYSREL